jgi:hypothetical protein
MVERPVSEIPLLDLSKSSAIVTYVVRERAGFLCVFVVRGNGFMVHRD